MTAYVVLISDCSSDVGSSDLPYTIYGLLRTADSVSPLAAPAVGASLIAFIIVYFSVFGVGTWYIFKLMGKPPEPHETTPQEKPLHAAGITPASGLRRTQ